jgi:MFS family permease
MLKMSALMGNDVAVTPEKFATTEVNLDTVVKPKTRQLTGIRWFSICVAIYSANFLYGLDNTIVADIQADISTTFNNVVDLGWLGSGFCLGCAVASFPIGHAYGLFDVKRIYISSLTMFAAASALCGAAPTMNAMIVGRVWAGAAGAGMYLGTLITSLCLPSEQPIYVGLIALVYGAGAILGPIVGGALADSAASWRWVSYVSSFIILEKLTLNLTSRRFTLTSSSLG